MFAKVFKKVDNILFRNIYRFNTIVKKVKLMADFK